MRSGTRLRDLNPLRLLQTNFSYQQIPTWSSSSSTDGANGSTSFRWPSPRRMERWRCWPRMSMTRLVAWTLASLLVLFMLAGGGYHTVKRAEARKKKAQAENPFPFPWQQYRRLNGYYNGVRTLVPYDEYDAQNRYNKSEPPEMKTVGETSERSLEPTLDPIPYNPYPDYGSYEYTNMHHKVEKCYLDAKETVPAPDVYVYPGLPQYLPQPFYGSYSELGLREDICFDRFGRLGPYGYGYNESMGGHGAGQQSEHIGSDKIFDQTNHIDYSNMDWGSAQKRCLEKNKLRFEDQDSDAKRKEQRHAYVLRTWTGYKYDEHQILSLRAMINELSLKSGGEYDVHFLVHVKNNSIPIWADEALYNETLQNAVPKEFWNISTLWSEQQMMMYYPEPFVDNFANMAGSNLHGVYRSAHFALQWFSRQHPEYDFYWNWEMDMRYSGHYYEFNTRIGEWAKKQPRKGLWERSRRFWFPKFHGDYQTFTKFVEQQTVEVDIPKNDPEQNGPVPIWGPVQDFEHSGMLSPPPETQPPTSYEQDNYSWGVGEDADLLVFNPLFDPSLTNWVFRADMTGYNRSLPIPPRRAAIITVARLSKRLLNTMHEEVWRQKHTAFPEMWAPTVCMHHGLKAAYVPHPVYFDRDWDLEYMNQVFNFPTHVWASPFGWGENNLLGSTFYYNSGFSAALWRRWLGQWENGEGGKEFEEKGSGRMCLRPLLHHPVKYENGPLG